MSSRTCDSEAALSLQRSPSPCPSSPRGRGHRPPQHPLVDRRGFRPPAGLHRDQGSHVAQSRGRRPKACVTFAYTTAPVCSPSRSAFLTGMYQTTIGRTTSVSSRRRLPAPAGVRLIPGWFPNAGYFTANVRHFPGASESGATGKTDWNFPRRRNPSTPTARPPEGDTGRSTPKSIQETHRPVRAEASRFFVRKNPA